MLTVTRLLRPLPVLLILAAVVQAISDGPGPAAREPDLARALSLVLVSHGLEADPADIHFIDGPPGAIGSRLRRPRALLRAHHAGEPSDIFLAAVRLSPEGRVLELTGLYDLSDTSAVDEQQLVVDQERAAWVIAGGGRTYHIAYADLRGEPSERLAGWSKLQRWQNSVTNEQQTGRREGIARRAFRLDPAAQKVVLGFSRDALLLVADGRHIRVPTETKEAIEGERFLREQTVEKARPGNLVSWAVDRVRALPWFGSDRMQAIKAVSFTALDWLERGAHAVFGDEGRAAVTAEAPGILDVPATAYTDPETGWPPPPMEPMLHPALEGEGKWVLLDKDPFVIKNPGAPSPFAFSFVRVDRKRAYSQTYVLVWDPRQVVLHAMSGTVEPKSATGETGKGLVPRKPEVIGRLIAAFNGGFQATHGEFGMMAEGVVYLPPKPFAATVAELADGTTGFGTWPRDDTVPDAFISFRQNMTPLVMDDAVNPYKRAWWGGVPPGWTDESRTVRSAVCLTKEDFVAYLYGTSLDPDTLTFAMQRARCVYGIHLDMNPGHTGLELYRTAPAGKLPNLGHALDPQWESKGPIEGMVGWEFMGRRLIRYMGLMNFPRYIGREARDFFYLTLRRLLPSEPVETTLTAEEGEGQWTVKGLPQHGFPNAFATSFVRPEPRRPETKIWLVEIDPRAVRVARDADEGDTVIVFRDARSDAGNAPGLFLTPTRFGLGQKPPDDGAQRIWVPVSTGARAAAALGVRDLTGMLVYAEVATAARPEADGRLLESLLTRLGCSSRVLLEQPLGIAVGGERDLAGHPISKSRRGLRLVRAKTVGARRIFPDTPIVSPNEWFSLQARRVRYFKKPDPASSSLPNGEPAASGAPAKPE